MQGPASLSLAAAPLTRPGAPIDGVQVRAIVDAAADAGFIGISIDIAHHDSAAASGMSSEQFVAYHRYRGLSIPAAEVILEWAATDQQSVADHNKHVLDVASRAGAASVIAATLETEVPVADVAARAANLCALAEDRGLAISFEFLPHTAVGDLPSAARLLEAVDRENFGVVIDTWHWFLTPGGPDLDALRRIPPDRVHILQLNDAPASARVAARRVPMDGRMLPGEGVIDIAALLFALDEMGATPVIVTEVFSSSLRALDVRENARRQFAAGHAVLSTFKRAKATNRD